MQHSNCYFECQHIELIISLTSPPMNSLALVPVTTVNSSTLVTLTSSLATTATAISSVLGMVTINHAPTISVAAIRS